MHAVKLVAIIHRHPVATKSHFRVIRGHNFSWLCRRGNSSQILGNVIPVVGDCLQEMHLGESVFCCRKLTVH